MSVKPVVTRALVGAIFCLCAAMGTANAAVSVSPLFSSHMVLQRSRPVPVYGTASPGENVTVTFNSQTTSTIASAQGHWQAMLPAMSASVTGKTLTITGSNTINIADVVVGDVWVCSGQSNMAFSLWGCNRQTQDVNTANFPGIRHFWVPLVTSDVPLKSLTGSWAVCSPSTAGGFSAVAFYFGRKIYQDQGGAIPIGLIASTVGGTCIDPWLAPEGGLDIPVLRPLYSQGILPWGPFSLFNGMIYPLAPYGVKGAIWYQGESRETTNQSVDSYYLKTKALVQGWQRLWGMDDFAFYHVQLANYLSPPTGPAPETGASWPDTRQQQTNALALPHSGMAVILDVGEAADIHPKDKLDVGERLAFWALKNDYGRSTIVPSGPILKDVTVEGSSLVCSFDYVGSGLMVGSKTPYQPTQELTTGTLQRFAIAGSDNVWHWAGAAISGSTVVVSSPSVPSPRKVAYAYWINPSGCNLYNKEGLPASPFYVNDVAARYTINASAGTGGSITPSGAQSLLKRMTALYVITPDPGYYVQDVKVDGLSVGAVKTYTFDPVYADHTIEASFSAAAPTYQLSAVANGGGRINPSGTFTVEQGSSQTFLVTPDPGVQLVPVMVDGLPVGKRTSFTFSDIRTSHTIAAFFACTIEASAGYGGTISPSGTKVVAYGADQAFTIAPMAGYSVYSVVVDGTNVGEVANYTFNHVTTSHAIAVTFIGGSGSGSIPRTEELIFSCLADSLPASGPTGAWPTHIPSGKSLSTIGTPTAETINGRKWERNVNLEGDGYNAGHYSSPIACNGATVVVAAKPVRAGDSGNWRSIVDVFYDRLVFGLTNDTGQVCVRRNGSLEFSAAVIPEGQTTVLSLVVQPDGRYKAYANGIEVLSNNGASAMTSLVPGVAGGFANDINVGRNQPDGWTTFNGYIGDVFLYKKALTDAERQELETYIAYKLTGCTIKASASGGGAITSSGTVLVTYGGNQGFTITPANGNSILDVVVDGASVGAVSSYTFNGVTANHTISVKFSQVATRARWERWS